MTDEPTRGFSLVDGATAATLAQIMPVLLLTLVVELRRTQLHRRLPRGVLGAFFVLFGVVETTLVLSIDGALYPFEMFDACSALLIFLLLWLIFRISLLDSISAHPGDGQGPHDPDGL